ncbi:hypothetical protein [Streptomyces achromogenes]|uniref:hypothetical protein n=1 Tax=Streptomyces achromogenes TaxID=67255 RepID=UPI0036FF3093
MVFHQNDDVAGPGITGAHRDGTALRSCAGFLECYLCHGGTRAASEDLVQPGVAVGTDHDVHAPLHHPDNAVHSGLIDQGVVPLYNPVPATAGRHPRSSVTADGRVVVVQVGHLDRGFGSFLGRLAGGAHQTMALALALAPVDVPSVGTFSVRFPAPQAPCRTGFQGHAAIMPDTTPVTGGL